MDSFNRRQAENLANSRWKAHEKSELLLKPSLRIALWTVLANVFDIWHTISAKIVEMKMSRHMYC